MGGPRRGTWRSYLLFVSCALPLLVAGASPPEGPSLRLGLTRTALPSGQEPGSLTDFAFVPGGGTITTGKEGTVIYVSSEGDPRLLARIPVEARGDLGLIAVELDRGFATTGELYTSYTYASDGRVYSRLSRWRVDRIDAPTRLLDEEIVLDGIRTNDRFHSIGAVVMAPDGTLFVGVGDGGRARAEDKLAFRAQDLGSANGKILRTTREGAGVPANPFFEPSDATSWRSRVYAMGLRNPFRFALHPETDVLYVGDVGWKMWEEINVVSPGDNFGWPCWEGEERTKGYRHLSRCRRLYEEVEVKPPLHSYRRDDDPAAIIGGIFVPSRGYPPDIGGTFLFGDAVRQEIRALHMDRSDRLLDPPTTLLGSRVGGPVRFRVGPDDRLYYADIVSGGIWKLEYPDGAGDPLPVPIIGLLSFLSLATVLAYRLLMRGGR